MYGTIARMRVKPGMADRLQEMTRAEESRSAIPGYVATHIYQMDSDPNEYYMAVIFESKEAYVRNADSPEQDASYRGMVELLDGEPEWHDGEIVYSTPQSA